MNAINVLTIGPDYRTPKGGVAAVEKTYSVFYHPFNHISTVTVGNWSVKLFLLLRAYFLFITKMFDSEVAIVHVHGASNASFWRKSVFILTAKCFKKKIVYHIHGGGFKIFAKKHPKSVKYIIKKCDAVVALSETWKNYFKECLKANHVVVIPNPVEQSEEDHSQRDDNVVKFLFLGSVNKAKGIYDMLTVIGEERDLLKGRAVFYIGGIGEIDKMNTMINQYKIDDIVQYVGWVDGKKKIDLFNMSHVFILPSYIEGVPICILEAETYHLPIITTKVGGIPSIVEDKVNGYLLNPGDKHSISNAIFDMINNKNMREKMGAASYQYAEPHLLPKIEKDLIKLYNSLNK